jgi:hypothetical protein
MAKTPKGTTIDLASAERGIDRSAGHGFNSKGIEDVLRPRASSREGLHPMPAGPGSRMDSNVPLPTTKHIASNTVKSERFERGVYPGSLTDIRPGEPAIGLQGNKPTADAPVPSRAERPDTKLRTHADNVRHARTSATNRAECSIAKGVALISIRRAVAGEWQLRYQRDERWAGAGCACRVEDAGQVRIRRRQGRVAK